MSRYRDSVCKLCRREGVKLFLKADRCYTDKCAIERRPFPPGQHGQSKKKLSEYGVQLREKQKLKEVYGVGEKQFRLFFARAKSKKGTTGDNLLSGLELRLDSVVYKMGLAGSIPAARQLVRHRHVTVNGKKLDIPSYVCRQGDVVSLTEKSKKLDKVIQSVEGVDRRGVPEWIELDKNLFVGVVKSVPSREQIQVPAKEQLIVELYSK